MRLPFVMLLTIHAFITRADCTKQVPLAFILMSGRKTSDYVAVFESIKNAVCGTVQIEGMVMDYERALWRAAKTVFPDIRFRGCAFHWAQAVWSHVQQLGLATQYHTDKGTHSFVRKLLALPFLPHEHIQQTFQTMKDFNSAEALNPLLAYVEKHWLQSPFWTIREWCMYGQPVRTNNDVEGWHRRLNGKTGASPPFYVLLDLLYKEGNEVNIQVALVTDLNLKRLQRNKVKSMSARLFKAWEEYRQGSLTTSGLLKIVSVIYSPKIERELQN